MAIFNESYTELMVLNEKKTREEYAKRAIKKKYNFEPDKPGSSTGIITDKQGKKYRVDFDSDKTSAVTNSKDSKIYIGKEVYNLKGSHKGERRDAVLQHEIGHQNLHNINPDNRTVDRNKRSIKFFDKSIENAGKDLTGKDINSENIDDLRQIAHSMAPKSRYSIHSEIDRSKSRDEIKKIIYRRLHNKSGYEFTVPDEDTQKKRDNDYEKAEKYSKKDINSHANAEEFEADRFAANRTSERAIKKSLSELNKKGRKDRRKYFQKRANVQNGYVSDDVKSGYTSKDEAKNLRKKIDNWKNTNEKNSENERKTDFEQRSKALKDKDLRKAKTYK